MMNVRARTADGSTSLEGPPIALLALGIVLPNAALQLPANQIWLGLATVALGLGVAAVISLVRRGAAPPLRPSFDSVILGLIATAVLYNLTWLGMRVPLIAEEAGVVFGLARGSGKLLGAALVVGILGEELFWRGAVLPALAERTSRPVACLAASAVAAVGFLAAPTWLLPAAVFGTSLVWNGLLLYARDLTAPLVSHFTWDVLVLVVAPPL